MVKENIMKLKSRKEIIKHIKEIKEETYSNLEKSRTIKKYEYYKCDYCGDEIRLDIKRQERSGGIATIPHSITKCGKLELALCNKCLNKVLAEFQ